ncbi:MULTISPECIES: hydrogenase [Amycolatopsis]|uniref:Hydrogenase n=1 Tax=Amycolatopsis echigonensis TaxID=2576905 RepID=A0A2N3WLI2_9PSEU|nr:MULTISPECIES: hydrogenase [Amycolatopsis]MBB2500793.1 hydrogenase [Amycolatopsis echigonensis]MCG3751250.1 hydrogenase [Amycolatopsis sp. Poz14]PKV94715.1 hydrogenase-4 component E [Amycolatopsis niigatensis]
MNVLAADPAAVAPPGVYAGVANGLAVLVLLTEFAMLRTALLRAQVRVYAAQSLLVSLLAVVVAVVRDVPELYALAALSLALKVIVVPWLVLRMLRTAGTEIAGSGALGVASEVLLAVAVAAFGFFATGRFQVTSPALPETALALSVAVILVAFVLMIVRRDVVSQAIGFFSLENGVSLASLVVAAGMPLILEVAFLFDLLVAVVVFGVLMQVHHRRSESLSTRDLTKLRG